eukprot:TRINITY_DN11239_c0_g2_i2.p1 TRINITY_DN11239_c0_g2~~TRINITY_DN11239_c0_g2_i2.p1  ORF type:complete len:202 (+),score=35.52 TRINITY_DN11239_c0_g2_i2:146-751(+)
MVVRSFSCLATAVSVNCVRPLRRIVGMRPAVLAFWGRLPSFQLVGNCVGMHNRRHFLAFLFWSEVYAMYTLAFGLTRLPALQALFGSGSADAAPDGASRYEAALVCYLLGSATVVLSFVGFVLFTEMMLLRRGKTYVGDLKYADEDSEQEVSMAAAYRRLRTLFLGEPAWTWPFTWFPATPPCAGARSNALWCTSPMDKES